MGKNKLYRRGATLEYKIKDILEKQGYSCVRSAGSHGFWDIAAVNESEILLIQAKREKNKTSSKVNINSYKKDIEQLQKLSNTDTNRKIQLWVYIDRVGFFIYSIQKEATVLIQQPQEK